jgi:MFS family permease
MPTVGHRPDPNESEGDDAPTSSRSGLLADPTTTSTGDTSATVSGSAAAPRGKQLPLVFRPRGVFLAFLLLNFLTYFDRGAIGAALTYISTDPTIATDGPMTIFNSTPTTTGGDNDAVVGRSLSDTEAGSIVSAFMVGFFITCPLFAMMGGWLQGRTIILLGLTTWMAACLSTSFSQGLPMLLISRCLVGVGEAAYAGYTVTIIDNIAPKAKRTMWIGTYYSMIPVGTAVGMGIGGLIAASSPAPVGSLHLPGWRLLFAVEILPAVPLLIYLMFLPRCYNPFKVSEGTAGGRSNRGNRHGEGARRHPPPEQAAEFSEVSGNALPVPPTRSNTVGYLQRDHSSISNAEFSSSGNERSSRSGGEGFISVTKAVPLLFKNKTYLLLVFGYAMYTFVIGAVAVWSIPFLEQGPLALSPEAASIFMGATTCITGLLGSIMGGVFVDRIVSTTTRPAAANSSSGSRPSAGASPKFGLRGLLSCVKLLLMLVAPSIPLGWFALLSDRFYLFAPTFVIGVFLLFGVTAPMTVAILTSVPSPLRTYAISFSVFLIHLLGDFPSPVIAGALSDAMRNGCSLSPLNISTVSTTVTEAQCLSSGSDCKFFPGHDASRPGVGDVCVNLYQLRNALAILWSMLILAIPAWSFVAFLTKQRIATELNDVEEYEQGGDTWRTGGRNWAPGISSDEETI